MGKIIHGEGIRLGWTPEYRTWISIRSRCNNPKATGYKYYGGRGVKVCSEWKIYKQFLTDMGRKPSDDCCIERIDNGKGYSKDNCKWIINKLQSRNRTNSIIFNGETATEASIRLGGCKKMVNQRIRFGWSIKEAFLTRFINKNEPKNKGFHGVVANN
jgi:hypothetical protein